MGFPDNLHNFAGDQAGLPAAFLGTSGGNPDPVGVECNDQYSDNSDGDPCIHGDQSVFNVHQHLENHAGENESQQHPDDDGGSVGELGSVCGAPALQQEQGRQRQGGDDHRQGRHQRMIAREHSVLETGHNQHAQQSVGKDRERGPLPVNQ